jgi:hypothetical protein
MNFFYYLKITTRRKNTFMNMKYMKSYLLHIIFVIRMIVNDVNLSFAFIAVTVAWVPKEIREKNFS